MREGRRAGEGSASGRVAPWRVAVWALLFFVAGACGGGGWMHVIVPTDTTSSASCVAECLEKSAGARYKCYTKCPGHRTAKGMSCDEAMASLRAEGWSYGGAFQCESSK